ncbi:MAG TPA: hypothetical protein DEP04_11285 [Dehalococcoidia bacterium]|nr:hypothetical protein [Dehalococcoidia bacterium]|tara:strand:+ start:76 stop:273 length:198 start_codon:yes stop_codon:yes gene_type:complete
MNEYQAHEYWELSYNDETIKRLGLKWDEISDNLSQPENINLNLELRKVEALEEIAEMLAQFCNKD